MRSLKTVTLNGFFIPFLFAVFVRVIPLFWSSEVFDVTLYRHQAIAVLDHINPYLYTISPAFSTLRQPYVYLPFSVFYAPAALQFSQYFGIPFQAVIKFAPLLCDLATLAVLYLVLARRDKKFAIQAAWLYALSPVSILITSFHGNIMSGPTLMTLIAFLLFEAADKPGSLDGEGQRRLSGLFLGLAIAWRTYPVFLLPAFLVKTKNRQAVWRFLFYVSLPVVVTTLPFIFVSPLPLFKSLTYTGVNGLIGWHSLPLAASGSLFLNSPIFPALRHLAESLTNHTHVWDKPAFVIVYVVTLFLLRKRLDLLRLILLTFLMMYFLLTTIAQQYFIWALPFIVLWSIPAAWAYSLLGGLALLVVYWVIYPEMLFGIFPVIHLSVSAEYWFWFISETLFLSLIGLFIGSLVIQKNTNSYSFNTKLPDRWARKMERGFYFLILMVTFCEIIYLFNLDPRRAWKAAQALEVETAQKKNTQGKIIRNLPMPRVTDHKNGFLWFDPTDRSVKILGEKGEIKNEFVLKDLASDKPLDVSDIESASDGSLVVTDCTKGFIGKFSAEGKEVARLGRGQMMAPSSLAIAPDGRMAVIDTGSNLIFLLSATGEILKKIPYFFEGGSANIERFDIGMDGQGSIYLLDGVKQNVRVFSASNSKERVFPVRIFSPGVRLAVSPSGLSGILNLKTTQISFYSSDGRHVAKLENDPDSEPSFGRPCAVWIDGENRIFIADVWKFKILEIRINAEQWYNKAARKQLGETG